MATAVIAADLLPALGRLLEAGGLSKAARGLARDAEAAAAEDAGERKMKKRIVRRLEALDVAEACRQSLEADEEALPAGNLCRSVALRRFLEGNELQRALKALDKELAAVEDEAPALGKRLAKRLANLDVLEACRAHLEAPAAEAAAAETLPAKKKTKEETAENGAEDDDAPKKGKKRSASEALNGNGAAANDGAEDGGAPRKKRGKAEKAAEKAEKPAGVPFKRVDDAKWNATIKDSRMLDNTHKAKQKFGGSVGDTWGDKAAEDLLKVKGKGFRKEMAKKKRASWKGGGAIDMGVNSIKFEDSSDEE